MMDINQLRDGIWAYLFEARAAKTIDEIATHTGEGVATVGAAVNHEWFAIVRDRVSIAYTTPNGRDHR